MSEGAHLGAALRRLFTHPEVEAFATFAVASDGLTAAQAAHIPAQGFNSIWAIVNHLWFWNEVPYRMLSGQPVAPEDLGAANWGGWVSIGEPHDETAWQTARERTIKANAAFADHVATLSNADMERELPHWGPIHSIVSSMLAHNSYHTCEIISVRHMQGLWLERT
jgi:hypothetical protein